MSAQTEIPFLDGMKVGLGFDVLTGVALKSTAVEGTSLTAPAQGGGQFVTTTLQIVQETSVLHQALGISVDVSAGNLFGDASAKFKFASDIAVNSFSLYVVVGVQVLNATLTLDNPVLSQPAHDLLKAKNQARFRDRFGDRFILGIKTGGEYFAVYKVESLDQSERTSVAASIHARVGQPAVAGASLDADISSQTASSKSKLDVSVYVYQSGGTNISTETTLDAIMKKAHLFPTLVAADAAVPYSMLLHDYTELLLPGDGLSFVDVQNQQDVLAFNAGLLDGFSTVVNDIDFIRKNIDQFKTPNGSVVDDALLAKGRRGCLQAMDAIRLQMSQCSKDATACTRIQVAPEDFAKLLPTIGDSSLTTVPNLVNLNISTIGAANVNAPFVGQPIRFSDEYGDLSYVADLAAEDIHFVPFSSATFVKEQDPPGGSAVSKGALVKLKLRTGLPA